MATKEYLSTLTDSQLEDLTALKSKGLDIKNTPDDQLSKHLGVEPKSVLSDVKNTVLGGVQTVGNAIDSVTGAPTRKAISTLQEGKGPLEALKSYGGQFGSSEGAPSGEDIVNKAGITGLRGKVGGVLVDVAADPTNILPVGAMVKGIAKGGYEAGKLGIKGAAGLADLITNTKMAGRVTNGGIAAAETTASAVKDLLNPKVAQDFEIYKNIANKHGIDPSLLNESVEFGPNSPITKASKVEQVGINGEALSQRNLQAQQQLQDAIMNRINKIGAPLNEVDAGELIKKGYNDGIDRLFQAQDVMHNDIIKSVPGLQLSDKASELLQSKLNGIERYATGRVNRGVPGVKQQGQDLLDVVAAARSHSDSYKQTTELLRDIGNLAFKSGATIDRPIETKPLQDLYFTLRDSLEQTVKDTFGKDAMNRLHEANQQAASILNDKANIVNVINNKSLAPEEVFNRLVKNGNTNKLSALETFLTPDQMNQVKASFLGSLIKPDADGNFSAKQLSGALSNKQNIANALLTTAEKSDLNELVKLSNRMGPTISTAPGVGASGIMKDLGSSVQNAILNKSFVDNLKAAARESAAKLPAGTVLETGPIGLKDYISKLPQRSRPEKIAKGLQVGAKIMDSTNPENK